MFNAWSLPLRHLEPRRDDKTHSPIHAPGGAVLISHKVGFPQPQFLIVIFVLKPTWNGGIYKSLLIGESFSLLGRGSPFKDGPIQQSGGTRDLGLPSKQTVEDLFLRWHISVGLTGRRLWAHGGIRLDSQTQQSKAGKVTGLCRSDSLRVGGEKGGMSLITECLLWSMRFYIHWALGPHNNV